MKVPDLPKLPEMEKAKQSLARSLVELVWDSRPVPQTFAFEYEGATWEVEVRVKQAEDASLNEDFTENLPE